MLYEPEIKSHAEVAEAQALFDAAEMSHWQVTGTTGTRLDHLAYFRAERVAPNAKREVIHTDARVLLGLAREVDARIASLDPTAVAVTSGLTADNPGG
jgi:hypothetical protein